MARETYAVGKKVEVVGDPTDEGFKGSFFTAVVKKVVKDKRGAKRIRVVYDELVEDDEVTKVKEDLPLDRVRPPPTDDSATKPVWQREPGEAVDMFVDDGWWQMYVVTTYDDRVEVHYQHPTKSEDYLVYADPKLDPDIKENPGKRIRSGLDWDWKACAWRKRPSKLFGRGGDQRSRALKEWLQREAQARQGAAASAAAQQRQPQQQRGKKPLEAAAARPASAKPAAKRLSPGAAGGGAASLAKRQAVAAQRRIATAGARAGGVLSDTAALKAADWSEEEEEEEGEGAEEEGEDATEKEESSDSDGEGLWAAAQRAKRAQQGTKSTASSDVEELPLARRKSALVEKQLESVPPSQPRQGQPSRPASAAATPARGTGAEQLRQHGAASKTSPSSGGLEKRKSIQQQQQQQQQQPNEAQPKAQAPAAAALSAPAPAAGGQASKPAARSRPLVRGKSAEPAAAPGIGGAAESAEAGAQPGGSGAEEGSREFSPGLGNLLGGPQAGGHHDLGSALKAISEMVDTFEGPSRQGGSKLGFLSSPPSGKKPEPPPAAAVQPQAAQKAAAPAEAATRQQGEAAAAQGGAAAASKPAVAQAAPTQAKAAAAAVNALAAEAAAAQDKAAAAATRAAAEAEAAVARAKVEAQAAAGPSKPVSKPAAQLQPAAEAAAAPSPAQQLQRSGQQGGASEGAASESEGEGEGEAKAQKNPPFNQEEKDVVVSVLQRYGRDYKRLQERLPHRELKNIRTFVNNNRVKGLNLMQYVDKDGKPLAPPAGPAQERQQQQQPGAQAKRQAAPAAVPAAAGPPAAAGKEAGPKPGAAAMPLIPKKKSAPPAAAPTAAGAAAQLPPSKSAPIPLIPKKKPPPAAPEPATAPDAAPRLPPAKSAPISSAEQPSPGPGGAPALFRIPTKAQPQPGQGRDGSGGGGVAGEAARPEDRMRKRGRSRWDAEDEAAALSPRGSKRVPLDFPTTYCIDNLGAGVTTAALQQALRKLGFTEDVRVVRVALGSGAESHAAGYAVLHFRTRHDADRELPRLRNLCMRTPACPIPRPLIAHEPRQASGYAWGDAPYPGHLPLDSATCPHFAQPNSIEFDMALEWRRLSRAQGSVKQRTCACHTQQLAEVFRTYAKDMKAEQENGTGAAAMETDEAPPPPPPGDPLAAAAAAHSRCLWLKGVSPPAVRGRPMDSPERVAALEEQLKNTFEQFGYPQKVELLRDPVTGQLSGQALVALESAERAALVAANLCSMVFIFNGTPRPLEAAVAAPGPPRGSQGVYDRALLQVFSKDDSTLGSVDLVEVPDSAWTDPTTSPAERAAVYLRRLMEGQLVEMDELKAAGMARSLELAEEQEQHYRVESGKLQRLFSLQVMGIMETLRKEYRLKPIHKHHAPAQLLLQPSGHR